MVVLWTRPLEKGGIGYRSIPLESDAQSGSMDNGLYHANSIRKGGAIKWHLNGYPEITN
jgi:hypothetical protein